MPSPATPPRSPPGRWARTRGWSPSLTDRLVAAGADRRDPNTAIVLAAAGSSDPRSVADVEDTADLLQRDWAGPVTTGYGSAAQPTVPDAVTAARRAGAERVVVAAYLLAPGHFADKLQEAGADRVTAPLLPDERIAAVLLDRYDAVVAKPVGRRVVACRRSVTGPTSRVSERAAGAHCRRGS